MAEWKATDFTALMFNVYAIPEGKSVLKHFAKLEQINEFRLPLVLNKDKAIKYIVYLYDKGSPLNKISNLLQRKMEACKLAGFSVDDNGGFEKDVEDMIKGTNKSVNKMIVAYLKLHLNFKYTSLKTKEQAHSVLCLNIFNGDADDKVIKTITLLENDIQRLTNELLNDDNNIALANELYKTIQDEQIELRPEDIAMRTREGKEPVKTRYTSDNYKISAAPPIEIRE